jgi:hypothetical protein
MSSRTTVFGSLENYVKGSVEAIDADPKHYVFSNVFEVAGRSAPYEKVCVGKNMDYVIEALRAEGDSPWFICAHDEAALAMDGEIEVHFVKPSSPLVPPDKQGTVRLDGEPEGTRMGWVKIGRGHMALLAKGSAYQFRSPKPGVVLVQTIIGDCTVERWSEICQTGQGSQEER